MTDVAIGEVLAGKYRVERVLGEGGMGVVLSATHLALDERVAIKLMRETALSHEDGVARFLREARAVVRLKSEHVARVLDVGTLETGVPYIVMEHLEGQDLAHVLLERQTLPIEEAVDLLLQACDAIAEAHVRGIIHRDLKPANLFVTRTREGAPLLKVLDFGISKVHALGDRPGSMTSSAVLMGSPLYMSPEQMKSSRDVGPETDVWSLGVILYEALGGRVPFDEQTVGALMARVLTEPPPPLSTLQSHVPSGLVAVVDRCLRKDPRERYASVADLVRDLAPFGGESAPARASRIVSLVGAAAFAPPSSIPNAIVSSPHLVDHPSILGVAATQALGSSDGAGRSGRGRLLFGGVGAAIVVAVIISAILGARRHTGASTASTSVLLQTPSVAPPSPPASTTVSVPSLASASPDVPPSPPVSAIPPISAASASSAASATSAVSPASRASPAPGRASHPSVSGTDKARPAADPFGNSRQ